MDQSALADKVQMSKSSISRILSGVQEPKIRLAHELARALGVSLDYLVDDSLEIDPTVHLVPLAEDELTILKIVRRLGCNVSIDRLLGVAQIPPELTQVSPPLEPNGGARFHTGLNTPEAGNPEGHDLGRSRPR